MPKRPIDEYREQEIEKLRQAIEVLAHEKECVKRQGKTGECCRDELGCGACDLVLDDKTILDAYDTAIDAMQAARFNLVDPQIVRFDRVLTKEEIEKYFGGNEK